MFHAYVVLTERGARAGYGRSPEFDWAYINTSAPADLAVITPPVPVAYADVVAREVGQRLSGAGLSRVQSGSVTRSMVRSCRRTARSVLRALGWSDPGFLSIAAVWRSSQFGLDSARDLVPSRELVSESARELGGRSLLREEAMRALASAGFSSLDRAQHLLAAMCIEGAALLVPAVSITPLGTRTCNRCGSTGPFMLTPCAHCGRRACALCCECRQMGFARECVPLYLVSPQSCACSQERAPIRGARAVMPHELTAAQRQAADMLSDWYIRGSAREVLVWAVCGAGKTEVSLTAIHSALLAGERVLYAAPRRDVVAELAPRVQAAFPEASCSVFHGGSSGQRDFGADIILATTHQAMRFYRRFDLAVLDEADAYPFAGSEALASSVDKALAPAGRLIIMTATPSRGHLLSADSGALPCIRIPARHHGMPLPVPEVVAAARQKGGSLPALARLSAVSVRAGSPLLVFVPRRRQAQDVAASLSAALPQARVEWVHSQDPARDDKRAAIGGHRCDVLVTTSVMERGVTVEGVDVIVCDADVDDLFDYRALIQMAGRAGRTAAMPTGRVWFVCSAENWHIRTAISIIRKMNAEAAARGLLAQADDKAPPGAGGMQPDGRRWGL